jgi:hypothetical protein
MSEPSTTPDPDAPIPDPSGQPPREPADVRRHLFFGLALLLAFGSMYAGVLQWGPTLQYGLAIAGLVAVIFALFSRGD